MQFMTSPPSVLTDKEINDMCKPLVRASAQIRYLRELGLKVEAKPGGRPLVARAEFLRVMVQRASSSPYQESVQPNREALLSLLKGKQHGAQAQKR